MHNMLSQKRYKLMRNGVKCDVLNNKMPSASGASPPDTLIRAITMEGNKFNEACAKCCALSIGKHVLCRQLQGRLRPCPSHP